MNPNLSTQNPWAVFINDSSGVCGGRNNSQFLLNGPNNNCCHSLWEDEAMDACVGGLGLFFVWLFSGMYFWSSVIGPKGLDLRH